MSKPVNVFEHLGVISQFTAQVAFNCYIAYLNKHTRQQRFTVHNVKTGLYRSYFKANTLVHISYFKHHMS